MLVLNIGPCCSKHSWEYFVTNLFFLGHNGSVVEHKYSLTLLSMSLASSQTQKSNKDGFFCSNIYLLILGRFRRRRRRHRTERLKITNANRSQGDGESKDWTNSFLFSFFFFVGSHKISTNLPSRGLVVKFTHRILSYWVRILSGCKCRFSMCDEISRSFIATKFSLPPRPKMIRRLSS